MIRKTVAIAVTLAIFLAVGCKSHQPQGQAPQKYKLMSVEGADFATTTSYSASIKGKQDVAIYPQVTGYLASVKMVEGQNVKKDEVLFIIEQAPFLAAYEAAKAGVEVAQAAVGTAQLNYDNAKELRAKNIISEAELQAIKNSLEGAKAQLSMALAQEQSAKTNLDFTVIKSPSNGVVGKLPYRQGTLVSANLPQPLTVVSDNSQMYVYFSITENQLLDMIDEYGSIDATIAKMPDVELELSNGSLYSIVGRVETISAVIENNMGAVSARAVFPNPKRQLISGGAGNIVFPTTLSDAIVIPKAATYEIQDKTFVYKVVDGKAKSTVVELSPNSNDDDYVVLSGLSVGDVIIAEGAGLVREGAPVAQ